MNHVGDNLLIFSSWKGFSRARLPPNVKGNFIDIVCVPCCVMCEVISCYCC